MAKSLATRLISGSILQVANLICHIIVSFFMMPFLIRNLGNRWYGFWSLAGSIVGYYGFLNLGLSTAVARFASRTYGQKDYHEMNVIINTSAVIFGILGVIILGCSLVIIWYVPAFIHDPLEITIFRQVILILGTSFAISFPMRAIVGFLVSQVRHDLLAWVALCKLLFQSAIVVCLIQLGYTIVSLAWITFLTEMLGNAFSLYLAKTKHAHLRIQPSLFRLCRLKLLFGYSSFTFVSQLADLLRFQIDSLVIAAFLRIDYITHYSIASRLMDYFMKLITDAIGIITPVFSQLEGQNDFETIHKFFLDATKVSVGLASFVGLSIIIYGKVFIQKWIGVGYGDSYTLLVILCVPFTLDLMQCPSGSLLFGTSKHRYYAYANVIEGLSNMACSLILVHYYGIFGVALGTAIPMTIMKLIVQPIYVCRLNKISWRKYFFNTVCVTLMKSLVPMLVYWLLITPYLKANYLNILGFSSVQTFIFALIFLFSIVSQEQRQHIREMIGLNHP